MSVSLASCLEELQQVCSDLDKSVLKTVAHRRKFQFAASQLRQFLQLLPRTITCKPATEEQVGAVKQMVEVARGYDRLIAQNVLQCWAHTALGNHANYVAADLCDAASRLNVLAKTIDENAASAFDASSKQWLDLHVLDLRGISASFKEFASRQGVDSATVELIQSKLNSIDEFFKHFDKEEIEPGVRVFSPIPVHYQSWRITADEFEEIREVGSGASAVVYFGKMKKTGLEVAIKKLKFKKLSGAKLEAFQRELAVLATAEHSAILKFIGATDTHPFSIVTEWMPNGSLYHDLHRAHKLDATMKTIAAFDIARGMEFLHSRQIIHRDLKSLNVLIDKNLRTRICDFGFSRIESKEEVMTKNVGTPHWMAPELLTEAGGYDNKVDVYAYGIVLWEILTGRLPYQGMAQTQIIGAVLMNNARPMIPSNCPPDVEALITESWARDPAQRPTFADIVRRFRNGLIFFEGADEGKVMDYINNCEPSEQEHQQKTLDLIVTNFAKNPSDLSVATELLEAISNVGIPENQGLAQKCWDCVQKIDKKANPQLYAKGCALFLSSMFGMLAARALREMPAGTVPSDVIASVIELVPTGSNDIDTDLVVAACKNNCHAQAAVHALHPLHVKLALEVCAQRGAPTSWKEAVVDRCVKYLTNDDPMLIVAAMRCLIALHEPNKIGIATVRVNLHSTNETLKMASYVAAAELALAGTALPMDLVDAVASRWNDPVVGHVVVCACKNVEIARYIVSRLEYGTLPPVDIVVQIMTVAAEHIEIAELVKQQIERLCSTPAADPELIKSLQGLVPRT